MAGAGEGLSSSPCNHVVPIILSVIAALVISSAFPKIMHTRSSYIDKIYAFRIGLGTQIFPRVYRRWVRCTSSELGSWPDLDHKKE